MRDTTSSPRSSACTCERIARLDSQRLGWKWNKWTRLETEEGVPPAKGVEGKLKASYEGKDDEWETFDFTFGEVNEENHILEWFGEIGPFGCLFSGYHSMRLEVVKGNENGNQQTTRLIHSEQFGGILPAMGLGLPFKTLDRNYLLMNESLKEHIEKNM